MFKRFRKNPNKLLRFGEIEPNGEYTLYLKSNKHASSKWEGYQEWLSYKPKAWKRYHAVKVRVDAFTCIRMPFGDFMVKIPPIEHRRLLNRSKVVNI